MGEWVGRGVTVEPGPGRLGGLGTVDGTVDVSRIGFIPVGDDFFGGGVDYWEGLARVALDELGAVSGVHCTGGGEGGSKCLVVNKQACFDVFCTRHGGRWWVVMRWWLW